MNSPPFFDTKNSLQLFGLNENFNFLSNLYLNNNLPKILLLSGIKGIGKSTLINHFLLSIFDEKNYLKEKFLISSNSKIYNQFQNNIFSNIIYLKGSDFKSIKIDDIRNLKKRINQSSILNKDRFIIFDDIALFNISSLNALLKTIEEPKKNDYFLLINNKAKPLLETIKSRSLEVKIILKEEKRLNIISDLSKLHKLDFILDPKESKLSPGNFIKFNYVFKQNNIDINSDYLSNLSLLLELYKKNKDILFINMAFFLSDLHFRNLSIKNTNNKDSFYNTKKYVFENLNNFILYNINQKSLINAINHKINNG